MIARQLTFDDLTPAPKLRKPTAVKPPEPENVRAEQFSLYRHFLRRLRDDLPDERKRALNEFRKKFAKNIWVTERGEGGACFADFVGDILHAAGVQRACSNVCDYEGKCPKCCSLDRCEIDGPCGKCPVSKKEELEGKQCQT